MYRVNTLVKLHKHNLINPDQQYNVIHERN